MSEFRYNKHHTILRFLNHKFDAPEYQDNHAGVVDVGKELGFGGEELYNYACTQNPQEVLNRIYQALERAK